MTDRASITVDPNRTQGEVSPYLFGQFLSRRRWVVESALHDPGHPDAGTDGIRRAVKDAIAASGPTVIRWPGGCTGTSYDWREGIGPVAERPRSIDWHFGYDVGNEFGTAEFVAFCRGVGAEPHLNIALGTESMRDALDWLEYTNGVGDSRYAALRRAHGRAEPFDVRFWQVGNEEWGDHEIGHTSAEDYATRAREYAKAMKKFDNDLAVLLLGGFRPHDAVPWSYEVLRQAWQYLDYLTLHTYWRFDPTLPDGDYDTVVSAGHQEERTITSIAGIVDLVAREKGSTRRPKLAFTEWNAADVTRKEMSSAWRPGETQYRLADALGVASFLNAMQRQCRHVGLASFAQSVNVVGALVVTPEAVVRETVYWPLLLQRLHSGPISVDCHVEGTGYEHTGTDGRTENIPHLDVSATMSGDRTTLWLSMVNRNRHENVLARCALRDVLGLRTTARLWQLHADDPLCRNTLDAPDAVIPTESTTEAREDFEIELPPHSYTIAEVPL